MKFNELAIASELRCNECEDFKQLYLDQIYFTKLDFIEENKLFEIKLLEDFEEHIKDKHLNRYNYFLKVNKK